MIIPDTKCHYWTVVLYFRGCYGIPPSYRMFNTCMTLYNIIILWLRTSACTGCACALWYTYTDIFQQDWDLQQCIIALYNYSWSAMHHYGRINWMLSKESIFMLAALPFVCECVMFHTSMNCWHLCESARITLLQLIWNIILQPSKCMPLLTFGA